MEICPNSAIKIAREVKVFTGLTILCYVSSLLISFIIGYSGYLLVFVANIVILQVIIRLARSNDDVVYKYNFGLVAHFGYAFLSLLGLLLIIHHQHYYNQIFDIWSDDRYFYNMALDISENLLLFDIYRIYNGILATIMILQKAILQLNNHPINVLPVNWLMGGLTLAYAGRLAYIIAEQRCRYSWLVLSILGNYAYTQNVAHLYRDVYVSILTLLVIIWAFNGKIGKGAFAATLTLCFRLSNSALNFCLLLIGSFAIKNKRTSSGLKASILLVLVVAILFGSVYYEKTIGSQDMGVIRERVTQRIPMFQEIILQSHGGTAVLTSLPLPLKVVLMPIVQLFQPVRFIPWDSPDGKCFFNYGQLLNHMAIGVSVTAFLWIFIAPGIVRGIYVAYKKNVRTKIFLLMTMLIIYYCGILSFQSRHRMILIILFPTFMALSTELPSNAFVSRKILSLAVVVLLLLFNLLSMYC